MRLLAVLLLMLLAWPVFPAEAGLDPQLAEILENLQPGEELSVLVTLADQADLSHFREKAPNIRGMSAEKRRQHRRDLVTTLRAKAENTQGPLKNFLWAKRARRIESLWIFNGLEVTAGRETIEALAARPEVADVRLNETTHLPTYSVSQAAATEWNLAAIHAPDLWSRGFTGQGVVIATLDSGVDFLHADIGSKWRGGTNSWFDPYGEHPSAPFDADGHGTAVAGVLVGGSAGGTAIGVAPDASWIAVKIFNDARIAVNSRIHEGFQWVLDPDGNPGTDDAPDVVNNSWGFEDIPGMCDPEFQPDVQALRAAGIFMSFAAGNKGNLANTSVSPANYPESFAVGAVDQTLSVPLFSSRGPSACDGTVFPELVAPGVLVKTADLTLGGLFPTSYRFGTGTSFAAPHVAGAAALLLSAFPGQSVSSLEAVLSQTASDLGAPGADNSSGFGLVNVLAAYDFLSAADPIPRIDVLPSTTFFGFGRVPVASVASQAFTIRNVGSDDLQLGSIAITGTDLSEFSLQNDLCSNRGLAPFASCTFDVVFTPLDSGKKSAVAGIPSNDPGVPQLNIQLSGNDLVRGGTYRGGTWYLDNGSGSWTPATDTIYQNFGATTDIPVSGDMNGDGFTEVGVYRPSTGQWFFDLDNSGSWSGCLADGGTDLCLAQFGAPNDIPVTGDWDGDGSTEVGTYRQGRWFLDNGNGVWDDPETSLDPDTVFANFGAPTDIPVTGDWDGDGSTEVGTYRQGQWFLDNGNGVWDDPATSLTPDTVFANFGAPDDIPVTGDWNDDGSTEVGTYREGTWYLDDGSGSWTPGSDIIFQNFGASTDIPVTGNWK